MLRRAHAAWHFIFWGGGFQKIRVIRFEGPRNKEYGILGSILHSFETKKLKSTGSRMLQIVIT